MLQATYISLYYEVLYNDNSIIGLSSINNIDTTHKIVSRWPKIMTIDFYPSQRIILLAIYKGLAKHLIIAANIFC